MNILEAMAAGRGVTIIPASAELTPVQAAQMPGGPCLTKLPEEGALPRRKVGNHRRIGLVEVIACKAQIDKERDEGLDQLAAEAQAHGMGSDD